MTQDEIRLNQKTNEGIKSTLWPYGTVWSTGALQAGPFAGFIVENPAGTTMSYTDGGGTAHTSKYVGPGYHPWDVSDVTAPANDVSLANYAPVA